jgi:hypothetical protein
VQGLAEKPNIHVKWVGEEYVAILVDEPQIGSLRMGQGMTFVRKDSNLPSHVCGRECGLRVG